jgi:hypothetical protein
MRVSSVLHHRYAIGDPQVCLSGRGRSDSSTGDVPSTKFSFFESSMVYSGAFVIQNGSSDQFVPGFEMTGK